MDFADAPHFRNLAEKRKMNLRNSLEVPYLAVWPSQKWAGSFSLLGRLGIERLTGFCSKKCPPNPPPSDRNLMQVNFERAVQVKQNVQHDIYERERMASRKLLEAAMSADNDMVRNMDAGHF